MLVDWEIDALAKNGMISPYLDKQYRDGGRVSAGLSSCGYDMRLAEEFKMLVPRAGDYLDPKNPNSANWITIRELDYFTIAPHGFVLARSVERWHLPPNICMTVMGKSTYARNGLVVNVTPGEPEWQGWLTLELSNTADIPSRVYVGEGIAQAQFHILNLPTTTYADRAGKYQNQAAMPVLAKV